MNRHPKNKTTKAENTKLYSLLIPLILTWSGAAASTPKACLTIHAGRALKSLCKRKANDHNERKNNESIN